jgi:hypothetical protein
MEPLDRNCANNEPSIVAKSLGASGVTTIDLPQELLARLEEFPHRTEQGSVDAPVDQLTTATLVSIEAQIFVLLKSGPNPTERELPERNEDDGEKKLILEICSERTPPESLREVDQSSTAPQWIPTLGFDALISQIKMAAATIASLIKENELLRSRASTALSILRADIQMECKRADQLQNEVEELQARHMRELEGFERSVRDMEAERRYLVEEVQRRERQLDDAMRYIDVINQEVRSTLESSMTQIDGRNSTRRSVA